MTCDNDYDHFNGRRNFIPYVKAVIVIVTGHSLEVPKSKNEINFQTLTCMSLIFTIFAARN